MNRDFIPDGLIEQRCDERLSKKQKIIFLALLEQEKQRMEQLTAGWDDPTTLDWDNEEKDEQEMTHEIPEMPSNQPIYKCTALYSYTVSA